MKAPSPTLPVHAFLAAALSATLATGCGRVPGQFEFVHNQAPDPGCAISADEGHAYQGQGLLDVSLVRPTAESGFWVFPLLKNNLPGSSEGVDVNRIVLESFAVDISHLTGPPALVALFDALNADGSTRGLLHFKTPWSGGVDSGGGTTATAVAAFPVGLAARLAGQQELGTSPSLWVNLQIRAFGHTTVQDIESDPFNYPVAVCAGCLVANVQPCPYTSPPANPGNVCNVAQDTLVDCCLSGNDLICPPRVVQ